MYKYPEYSNSETSENSNFEQTFPNIKKSGVGIFDRNLLNKGEGLTDEGLTRVENEGSRVYLDWVKYQNTNIKNSAEGDKPSHPDIILMPGYHTDPESKSIDQMSRSFLASAEPLGVENLYSIQTRVEGAPKDTILLEVEAMKQFLLELNLNELILAGFSQGALKMVKLASVLSKETENIKGLALINPVGLYKQTPFMMILEFLLEPVYSLMVSKNIPNTINAELDVVSGIIKDWHKSGALFPKILIQEIAEMSNEHPEISSIKCPVIVVQNSLESIVDPHETTKPGQTPIDNQSKIGEISDSIFENSSKIRWSLQKGGSSYDNQDAWFKEIVNFISTSNNLPGKSQE